jgi:3-deoxy-D-arabino-heptulosonate 7-phosphate (DAHP) synthase
MIAPRFLDKFLTAFLLCTVLVSSHAQESGTRLRLKVMDLKHHVKVDATIRLTSEMARESCMAGGWKRVIVDTTRTVDDAFFPLSGPLAFGQDKGTLTLGRVAVCDGYLLLTGDARKPRITGSYDTAGQGRATKRGYFSLTPIR